MRQFFDPKGIVVIGVSDARVNLGKNIVDNLVRWEFGGRVVAVGREAGEVYGVAVLDSMDDEAAFAGCDLAVILTPANLVPGHMRRCGALGINHVIVETAGFSELDGEGGNGAAQRAILEAARDHEMRFMGPNCVGLMQVDTGNILPFAHVPRDLLRGDTAIIAQSGGVGLALMRGLAHQGVGSNWMASVGNKLDVDEVDLAAHLVAKKDVGRVVMYLESIPRGRALCDLARSTEVPFVVHKANRSTAVAHVAQSHTAALANDDRVVSAALEQAGVLRATDSRETLLAAHATRLPPLRGRRIALLSRSGGHAVISADRCEQLGLDLPPFSQPLLGHLASLQRQSVIRRGNPLDLGDIFDFRVAARVLARVLEDDGFDGVVYVQLHNRVTEVDQGEEFLKAAAALGKAADKPLALAVVSDEAQVARFRDLTGWPVFDTPEDAVAVMGLLVRQQEARTRARAPRLTVDLPGAPPETAPTSVSGLANAAIWSLGRSLALVSRAGVPVADTVVHGSTQPTRFPVVAKHSADTDWVVHKAAVGLVRTGLEGPGQVSEAAREIEETAQRLGLPTGEVLVQSHLEGPEVFLGARRDPSFGPVVLFGCGGSLVELLDDVVCWPYPFGEAEIAHLVGRTKLDSLAGDLLDPKQLARWLAGLGALLEADPTIEEIDVNPVVLTADGPQAIDARVHRKTTHRLATESTRHHTQ